MSKWHKIIEGDKSTYPDGNIENILMSFDAEVKSKNYGIGAYLNRKFCDVEGDYVIPVHWCEMPTDEKCKFKYCINDGGFYLSSCSMSDYDKTDADYFIYCPRCGKEIEFV